MRGAQSLALLCSLAIGHSALATVGAPPTIEAGWRETIRAVVLPEPFGLVSVDLKTEPDTSPRILVLVNDESIRLSIDDLETLGGIELESISYSDPSRTSSGKVEYMELLVLFGESYKVRNTPCENEHNFTWERDIVKYRIDGSLKVSREIISFRELDKCGP
jgi:hypothetical protein